MLLNHINPTHFCGIRHAFRELCVEIVAFSLSDIEGTPITSDHHLSLLFVLSSASQSIPQPGFFIIYDVAYGYNAGRVRMGREV